MKLTKTELFVIIRIVLSTLLLFLGAGEFRFSHRQKTWLKLFTNVDLCLKTIVDFRPIFPKKAGPGPGPVNIAPMGGKATLFENPSCAFEPHVYTIREVSPLHESLYIIFIFQTAGSIGDPHVHTVREVSPLNESLYMIFIF